jgi:hypothetical protein
MAQSNFNMELSLAEKALIDEMKQIHFHESCSKAFYIKTLIYNDVKQFLGIPYEMELSAEVLYEELLDRKESTQESIKSVIGEERYNSLMKKNEVHEEAQKNE